MMDNPKGTRYSLDGNNSWLEKTRAYLEDQGFGARMLGVPRDPPIAAPPSITTVEEATVPRDLSPLTSSITSEDIDDDMDSAVVEIDHRTVPRGRGAIELYTANFKSGGYDFVLDGIPVTHELVLKKYLATYKNSHQLVKNLRSGVQYGWFSGGSTLMKSLIAVAVTSLPALPLSQACNVIPLFVAAILVDVGIIDRTKVSAFATAFPSETYLRDLVFNFAAENVYQLGARVKDTHVFLSCDKGNKKGVTHFVKILSWYDPKTTCVVKQLLDIDASGVLTDGCADAMAASLNKVGNIRLQG
jgi:hypothetical protein